MEKVIDKWVLRDPATQTWTELKSFFAKEYSKFDWHTGVKAKQAGYESASNIVKRRKREAEEERQIFMMASVTDIVQQLNEKNSIGILLVLEKMIQQQAKITKALKQIPSSNDGGKNGGRKSNKQHIDPNQPKLQSIQACRLRVLKAPKEQREGTGVV